MDIRKALTELLKTLRELDKETRLTNESSAATFTEHYVAQKRLDKELREQYERIASEYELLSQGIQHEQRIETYLDLRNASRMYDEVLFFPEEGMSYETVKVVLLTGEVVTIRSNDLAFTVDIIQDGKTIKSEGHYHEVE